MRLCSFDFPASRGCFFLPLYLANGAKLDVAQQKGKKKEKHTWMVSSGMSADDGEVE